MAVQKQDDQHEHTFSSYVRIRDVVLKTYLGRWTIGRSGERESGISVLPARDDDDDDDDDIPRGAIHSVPTLHDWVYTTKPGDSSQDKQNNYYIVIQYSVFIVNDFIELNKYIDMNTHTHTHTHIYIYIGWFPIGNFYNFFLSIIFTILTILYILKFFFAHYKWQFKT